MAGCLPEFAVVALREALPAFGKQIRGFDMNDALLTGVETRTSSPVRVTRGDDFQSINTRGLYPAGEGAGYAGGIFSAAIDGIKVAEALALFRALAAEHPRENRSDLAVFEATDIARGPIALAHLSSRVPAGFHGNWRPGTL